MGIVKPWGRVDRLLTEFGAREWHVICCASFEARSTVVPTVVRQLGMLTSQAILLLDPPADASDRASCAGLAAGSLGVLRGLGHHEVHTADLIGPLTRATEVVRAAGERRSVLLDITAMPKRYFMFIALKLLEMEDIEDIVVTYAMPQFYPEGALASDPEPVSALPGMMRMGGTSTGSTFVVGVGYMQFSLSELMEQARGAELKFLMPFPPGSPSARRNWRLLHQMDPNVELSVDIRRVHSLDMFEVLGWLEELVAESAGRCVDMIPLGPKPHSLAMALAYGRHPDVAQVMYAQPHSYRSDYSAGFAVASDGKPDAYAYCLRRCGRSLL